MYMHTTNFKERNNILARIAYRSAMKLRARFFVFSALLGVVFIFIFFRSMPAWKRRGFVNFESNQSLGDGKPARRSDGGVASEADGDSYADYEAQVDFKTLDLWRMVDRSKRRSKEGEAPTRTREEYSDWDGVVEAIIVPHSHNDPGWLETVDGYYRAQTKDILDNMLFMLESLPRMTFVWSEVVFLSMWWEDLDDQSRKKVKWLVKEGRLEILGGGWVVPDEACTHYSALVNNFLEGHLWLQENLDVRPDYAWSLDPFGYSSTMPYLYDRMGLSGSVMLRINSDVKQQLLREKLQEFDWRQSWDSKNVTDMRTFVLPYQLYNIKHQCGPDQDVCRKFDFRKIEGEYSESTATPVTDDNVRELSEMLARQYRLKASLQRNKKVVLIPLGDDFRYDKAIEWQQQYFNYIRLMDYMNTSPQLKVKARFGVVGDFFQALVEGEGDRDDAQRIPSLSGDFFPYMDLPGQYWTGFYSTRMWLKRLGGILAWKLHSAEVLFLRLKLLYLREGKRPSDFRSIEDGRRGSGDSLTFARQNLALFQHHDAITGTSRESAASDYARRLNRAISKMDRLMEESLDELLRMATERGSTSDQMPRTRLLTPPLLQAGGPDFLLVDELGTEVHVFNPLLRDFSSPITVPVTRGDGKILTVTKIEGNREHKVLCQYDDDGSQRLIFRDRLGPNWLGTYRISSPQPEKAGDQCHLSRYEPISDVPSVELISRHFIANFDSSNGRLSSVLLEGGTVVQCEVTFHLRYGGFNGAYLLGASQMTTNLPVMGDPLINRGLLFSMVRARVGDSVNVTYRVPTALLGDEEGITVEVQTDMKGGDDANLIMRLTTDIQSGRLFYTDSNGFTPVARERMPSMLPEANFYPATSYAFLETSQGERRRRRKRSTKNGDAHARVTVLMSDPHGVSGTEPGVLEFVLDRRVISDDGKGLGMGVPDITPTLTQFKILFEKLDDDSSSNSPGPGKQSPGDDNLLDRLRHLTPKALGALEKLQRPPVVAASSLPSDQAVQGFLRSAFPSGNATVPPDVTLVSLRNLQAEDTRHRPSVHLVFHKHATERSGRGQIDCQWSFSSLFPGVRVAELLETTLTMAPAGEPDSGSLGDNLCFEASSLNSFKAVFGKETL